MSAYKIPESVLVVIHSKDLEVLLIERADRPDFWQSVTGSKNTQEESFVEAAIREVAEETGIQVVKKLPDDIFSGHEVPLNCLSDWQLTNQYEIFPVWRHRYPPGVTVNTEHVFDLVVPRDIPVLLEPREHLRFIWLPYLEAADKCFSLSNAEAIRQLPARFHI